MNNTYIMLIYCQRYLERFLLWRQSDYIGKSALELLKRRELIAYITTVADITTRNMVNAP